MPESFLCLFSVAPGSAGPVTPTTRGSLVVLACVAAGTLQ